MTTESKSDEDKTKKYKFPYQAQEIEFLEQYYSSYLHLRGMTTENRISFVSGYIRQHILKSASSTKDYKNMEQIIAEYIYKFPSKTHDESYKSECKQIEQKFRKFREKYMEIRKEPTFENIPSPPPKCKLPQPSSVPKRKSKKGPKKVRGKDGMTEWERKYEEDPLVMDRKHVFNIEESIDAYYDYDMNNNLNLMPSGKYMLIAPNKLEYILPGDTVFCYILNGGYRRRRPRGRWYFWTYIENLDIATEIYKKHGVEMGSFDDYEDVDDDDDMDELIEDDHDIQDEDTNTNDMNAYNKNGPKVPII